jgi:TRAP-type mannitol/chloroaromatic compound transport system permease large subunit
MPPLLILGADPVWLSVLTAVNLHTSFLAPPFGFALFFLRSIAPAELATIDIYRGALPFIAIHVVALVLLWSYPSLVTYLPGLANAPVALPAGAAPDASQPFQPPVDPYGDPDSTGE